MTTNIKKFGLNLIKVLGTYLCQIIGSRGHKKRKKVL